MKYTKENILYKYAVEKKLFETYEIVEYSMEIFLENELDGFFLVPFSGNTVLASGAVAIIKGRVVDFRREKLIKESGRIKKILDKYEFVPSRLVKPYVKDKMFLSCRLCCLPLFVNVGNEKQIIGYVLCDSEKKHELQRVVENLAIMTKLNVIFYGHEEYQRLKRIRRIRDVEKNIGFKECEQCLRDGNRLDLAQMLKVAKEYTFSDAASIYIYDDVLNSLKLEYHEGSIIPPKTIGTRRSVKSVIAYTYLRNRSFLSNDVSKISSTYGDVEYLAAFNPNRTNGSVISELAIPICYASRNNKDVFGVLNLEKINSEYSRYDIEEIKNEIINRFLVRKELYDIGRSNYEILNKITNKLQGSYRESNLDLLSMCGPTINSMLKSAIKYTPAFSAVLRILDFESNQLVRFVAVGKKTDEDKFNKLSLKLHSRSVCAYVATRGELVYIGSLGRYKRVPSIRYPGLETAMIYRNAKSEFCLPIFYKDKVWGTLNFESDQIDAFDSYFYYLLGIAKSIEGLILSTQNFIEHAAFKEKTRVYYTIHDLIRDMPCFGQSIVDEVEKKSGEVKLVGGDLARYNKVVEKLKDLSDYYRVDCSEKNDKCLTVQEIIDNIVEKYGIKNRTKIRSSGDYYLSSDVSRNVFMALDNIIGNSVKYSQGTEILITYNLLYLRCENTVRISVGNFASLSLSDAELKKLYCSPVQTTDKGRRLGAFVAGCLVREVSGSIYFSKEIEDDMYLRTIVEIPYVKEVPDEKQI